MQEIVITGPLGSKFPVKNNAPFYVVFLFYLSLFFSFSNGS